MTTQSSSDKTGKQAPEPRSKLPSIFFVLKNLPIGRKLTIGFGILILLIFLSAGVSYLGSRQATTKINLTNDVRVPTALVASRAQANLLRMTGDVRGYLALGDQEYRDSYNQSNEAFKADLAELEGLYPYLNSDNKRRFVELKITYEQWAQLPDQMFELRDDQLEREPAYRILATDGIRVGGKVLIDINSIIEAQGQREASPETLTQLTDMAKFQGNFTAMLSALRGYVATRNSIFRYYEYEANRTANQNSWERLQGARASLTPNQQKLLDNIAKNRAEFLLLPDKVFEALEGERWREDLFMFREDAVPLAEKMQQLLGEMTSDQQTLLKTELASGRQDLTNANQLILASGVVALIVGLIMTYIARETIAGPVRRLTGIAEQIRGGDLEARATVESRDEIGILAGTFNEMTAQLRRTLLRVRKEKKRADDLLNVVIPIGVDLSSEKDFNRLLEKMLLEAKAFCHATAGILYLRTDDNRLRHVIIRDDPQQIALGGTTGVSVPFPPLALYKKDGAPNERVLAARVALQGATTNIDNAAEAKDMDFGPTESRVYADDLATSLLALPLKNSEGQVLGVLQLMNAQDPETNQIIPFDANLQQMMESFSSLAVAALEAYIREQKLQQQIQQLKIEIDEVKRQKQVSEIVDTDFFQDLRSKVRSLRSRGQRAAEPEAQPAPEPKPVSASAEKFARLQQALARLEKVKGVTPVEILELPSPLDEIVREMMRRGRLTLDELAAKLELAPEEARQLAELLIEKGFLQTEERQENGGVLYKVYFARMRGRNIPLDL